MPDPLKGVWKARSVFWDLPYWKFLDTPHSLDVMHITKNITLSWLGTFLNMPERTKDGPKARNDLKEQNIRRELHGGTTGNDQEEETEGHKRKMLNGMTRRMRRRKVTREKRLNGMNITAPLPASL